jgi:hypothetical protein
MVSLASRLRILLIGPMLAACTLLVPDSGDTRLIRHRALDAYPAALLEGTLRSVEGCLVVETDHGSTEVVVWPPDHRLGSDSNVAAVQDWWGHTKWRVGERVSLGGGEYDFGSIQAFLTGGPIPDACRLGSYWLASPS